MSMFRTSRVADLVECHGRELVLRMSFFDKALKEWGVEFCERLTSPSSILDYLVAESAGMIFDVEDGCVETWYCEEGSDDIYAVSLQPSRNLADALWASRVAGHGFCDDVTDPLDVCASILGRL